MNTRAVGHKLTAGTQTAAYMAATAIAITAWTRQSDMDYRVNWLPPVAEGSTTPQRTMRPFLTRSKFHGFYFWQWRFSGWSLGMLDYVYDNYFASGAADGLVTVKTYTEQDDVVYLTCTAQRPTEDNGCLTKKYPGMWADVILKFNMGSIIV